MAYDPYPLLQVWSEMTSELNDSVEHALNTYRQDRLPSAPSLAKLRTLWRPVPDQLDAIDEAIMALGENIATVAANSELTQQAIAARLETLIGVGWTKVQTSAANVRAATTAMLGLARAATYPARPEPQDVLQETRLASIKTDLRMALDPLGDEQAVVDRIKQLLARALAGDDALSAWLLASSNWPTDYLTSRGFDVYLSALTAEVDDVIAEATPDAGAVMALYRELSDPQTGLPGVDVLLGMTLAGVWDTVSKWRPTNTEPTPPSRRRPTATDPTMERTQLPPVARTENTMPSITF